MLAVGSTSGCLMRRLQYIYRLVNVSYTSNNEKIPSYNALPRDVYGRIRKFYDVESST